MSLSSKTTSDLIRIAAAGGGLKLPAGARTTSDLIRIASAASNHSAKVYFSGISNRTASDLIRIGSAGKGSVVFED
jgi:hypothetical protein